MTTYEGTLTGHGTLVGTGALSGVTEVIDQTDVVTENLVINGDGTFTGTEEQVTTTTVTVVFPGVPSSTTTTNYDSGPQQISGNVNKPITSTSTEGGATATTTQVFNSDNSSIVVSGTLVYTTADIGGTINFGGILASAGVSPAPTLLQLAQLSADVYNSSPGGISGFALIGGGTPLADGLSYAAYATPDHSQIVIAFRGTDTVDGFETGLKNLLADTSFPVGNVTPDLAQYVSLAAQFVAQVARANPGANITLTGHSLGGGIAQIIGQVAGLTTDTFDAPGGALAESTLKASGALSSLSSPLGTSNINNNYRMYGDQVSLAGNSIGGQYTIANPWGSDNALDWLQYHDKQKMIDQLALGVQPKQGIPDINYLSLLGSALVGNTLFSSAVKAEYGFFFSVLDAAAKSYYLDPSAGFDYIFTENAGSPAIYSIMLPQIENVAYYQVSWQIKGVWSNPLKELPNTNIYFANGTTGFEYSAFNGNGQEVPLPSGLIFPISFFSSGQVSATLSETSGSVPSDFFGYGVSDVLWFNSSSEAVGEWQMNNNGVPTWMPVVGTNFSQASSTMTIEGLGDFTGSGVSDVLWENPSNGFVGTWMMNGANATFSLIGQSSTTMQVVGIGDFTGNRTDDVLWENPANGIVGDWLMNNDVPTWQQIGQGSTTMKVVGIGDFNGNGTDDILWENPTNGVVGEWLMKNNVPTWQGIGQGSTTMNIVGVGDFLGNGTDDILWENPSNGTVGFWGMNNGQSTSWNVVGTASGAYQVAGIGDYYGNGTDDILWRNATTGDVGIWAMNNGHATWHGLGTSSTSFNTVKG